MVLQAVTKKQPIRYNVAFRTHSKQCDFTPQCLQTNKGPYKTWVYGVTLLFVVALVAFIFIQQTYAAIFSFVQTSWEGGSTANIALHDSNRTGWTEYASQSGLTVGADIRLGTPTPYTFTDDGTTIPQGLASGGGFSDAGVTHSQTQVTGSGSGASIILPSSIVDVSALVVGGGGGLLYGGGGGAGEFWEVSNLLVSAQSYPVTIGAGGGASVNGGNSLFSTITAIGGGAGGLNGGSGGGAGWQIGLAVGTHGHNGGLDNNGDGSAGGGGGGAGGNGGNAPYYSQGGSGGAGLQSAISGTLKYYAAGGGGTADRVYGSETDGVGGSGIGGGSNGPAVANTGSGGGASPVGAAGIVIISAPIGTIDSATGGTHTTANGNDIWTFLTSGTWTPAITASLTGTFTSAVIDLGAPAILNTFSYNASTTASSSVTMDVRAGNTATPDGTWTGWQTAIASGGDISVLSGNQYVQYRANFSRTDSLSVPSLNDVTIGYSQYTTGELTSSVYNANSFANLIARISWTALGESATDHVTFQIRSSPDGVTWSNWCGYTNCSGSTYFDVSRNGVVLNTGHPLLSGGDDQYFQYKATLTSGGAETPILTGVTVQYVVNATPTFDPDYPLPGDGGVSAIQNPDGTVTINYAILDSDTTEGSATANFVTPTFQYSLDNGDTWAGIDSAHLAAGDTANKAVQELTYTPYTATWYATTTLAGVYSNTVKVRVTVNDNEIANSTAYGLSSTITLDTKVPVLGTYPLLIDASQSPARITLSVTDNSTFEMKVGRVSDLSDASFEPYSSTKDLALTLGDTVYAQFRDAVGNTTSIISLPTLPSPNNIFYQDTSDVTLSEWRLFVAWGVVAIPPSGFKRYNVMRSVDGGEFTLLTTITNRSLNYYVDSSLNNASSYSYKISSEDNDGNLSFFSSPTDPHTPVGFGGSEVAPPTLSDVTVTNVSAVEATITWTTNKISNSSVYFSATSSYPGAEIINYENSTGVPSMVTTNSVVLSGLTPDTQYFFMAASADPLNNIGLTSLPSYTFTTLPGPVISNVTTAEIYDNEAVIVWNTDIPADSIIIYSVSPDISNPIQVTGMGDFKRNHRVTVSGLTAGTNYYYYVKSTDADGNTTTNKNVIDGVIEHYMLHTSFDTEPPVVTSVKTALIGETGATITWTTDKPATAWVDWGTDVSLGTSTPEDTVYSTRHTITLNDLISDYPYFYRVNSNSRSGFLVTDDNSGNQYTFTTLAPTTATVTVAIGGGTIDNRDLSTPEITDIAVTNITDTGATVTFTTSKVASGLVRYGLTSKYTDEVGDTEDFRKKHAVPITGLTPGTTYNFRVAALDIYENEGTSGNSTFTTTMNGEVVAEPVIDDGTGEEVSTSTTEMTLFDKVKSASSAMLEDLLKAFSENPNLSEISEEMLALSFKEISSKVTEPPTISGTTISVSVNSTSAVIEWTTDKEANSLVSYAPATEYNTGSTPYTTNIGFPDAKEITHEIKLDNLTPATTYHFQVKSESILGAPSISNDNTFTTTSLLPDIKEAKFDSIGENTVSLSWQTELPTMTTIELENTETGEKQTIEDKSYLEKHRTTLDDLEFSTAYVATLTAADTEGNTSAPFAMPFTTALSTGAPIISDVKINTSLIPGRVQMAQTIVSWKTNKPATSKVYYGIGGATELTQSIPQNKTLTRDHVMITTILQPGMVYKIQTESEDPAGNATSSPLYTVLTPTTQESVFDIISSNLSSMFGFLGGR